MTFCLRYVDSRAKVVSETPDIEVWSRNANSNAPTWRTFSSRVLRVPALANRSAWSASFATGHEKLPSTATALRRTS